MYRHHFRQMDRICISAQIMKRASRVFIAMILISKKMTALSREHGSAMAPSYSSTAIKWSIQNLCTRQWFSSFATMKRPGKHTQITSDKGNKDEASWSPCGNYLLYFC